MNFGKTLFVIGLFLVACGAVWLLLEKIGISPGRLPGDIVWKKGNSTFYLPITTSILVSLLLSLLLWLLKK